jgi:hypothetical protein
MIFETPFLSPMREKDFRLLFHTRLSFPSLCFQAIMDHPIIHHRRVPGATGSLRISDPAPKFAVQISTLPPRDFSAKEGGGWC